MSGGSLDYAYSKVDEIANNIVAQSATPLHLAFACHLRLVAEALHDLEWVFSFDKSPGDEEKAIRKIVSPQDELKSVTEDAKLALANLGVAIKRAEKS